MFNQQPATSNQQPATSNQQPATNNAFSLAAVRAAVSFRHTVFTVPAPIYLWFI